jgi:hypothetical protein
MPLANLDLYQALRDLGVSEDRATRAAEASASVNRDLLDLRSEMRTEFATVRTDIAVLKAQMEHLHQRFSHLTWGLGIGFSFVMALLLLEANWLWQLMQRVH